MERFDRPRQALAICLAMLAGYIDAVGYLSADSYFVSFMSGNTTRLAVDLAQDWRLAVTPALLIVGFVAGVASGYVVAVRSGRWRKPAVLVLVILLLLSAGCARTGGSTGATLAALVLAMGALNNTLQRDETPIALTYMTGALVRIGQGLGGWLCGRRRRGWPLYALLWLGLAGGAFTGALAYRALPGGAIWFALIATAALAAFAARLAAIAPR